MKKSEALIKALADIQKTLGKEVVTMASEKPGLGYFSTGSVQLDYHLGGGFPRGRMVELFGPESSGKTTLALHTMADVQKQGTKVIFADFEGSYDPVYAASLGVNNDEVFYIKPDTAEVGLSAMERLGKTGEFGLIVIDSVATMLPMHEQSKDFGDHKMSLHARMMGDACKRLLPLTYNQNMTILWINQIREKPGGYGNPEYTTGGNALKYYAVVRLDIRKSGSVHKDDEGLAYGEPRKIKIVKTKISPTANATMMVDIIYGEGIDRHGEIFDMAVNKKLISKAGSWYSYGDVKIGQGRPNGILFLKDNPEVIEEIKSKIFEEEGDR